MALATLAPSREHIKEQPLLAIKKEETTPGCDASWDRALYYTGSGALFPVAFSPTKAPTPSCTSRASSGTPPLHSRPVILLAAHSSPLSCGGRACRHHDFPAAKQRPASHHSDLHRHSLLIPRQAQSAVQPYYAQ